MTAFATATAIASFVIFAGFVALGVRKFGWRKSYSDYASKWSEAYPIHNVNLWSFVTVVVALLLFPSMIERGQGNAWQFLGFFAPIYLCIAAFTPRYQTDKTQHRVHVFGAIGCALISLLWLILICKTWWVVLIFAFLAWCASYSINVHKENPEYGVVFWGEMTMFLSVYTTLLLL